MEDIAALQLFFLPVVCALNVGLGLFVYAKNRKRLVNVLFTCFLFSLSAWTFSAYLFRASDVAEDVAFWGRMAFVSASFIALFFYLFSLVFPERRKLDLTRPFLWLFTGCGVCMALIAPTSLLIESTVVVASPPSARQFDIIYGPGHPFFGAYFLLSFSFGLMVLGFKWRQSKGIARLQIQYLFSGVLVATVGGVSTNLLIPLFFHTSQYSGFGPLFTVFISTFTAHAIVRYRLMDIRLFLKKGLIYFISLILMLFIVGPVIFYLNPTMRFSFPLAALILLLGMAFAGVAHRLEYFMNLYFFRVPAQNHQRTLRQASQLLTTVLDLPQLFDLLTDLIVKKMLVDSVTIFLHSDSKNQFVVELSRNYLGEKRHRVSLPENSFVVQKIRSTPGYLVRDEVERFHSHIAAERVLSEFAGIGAELIFPLALQGELMGIIAVGSKLSGDSFFADDLETLKFIVDETAVATRNAQLYQQVMHLQKYQENVLNNIESGVIATNRSEKITLINATAEKKIGVKAHNAIGMPATAIPLALARPILDACREGRTCVHSETTLLLSSGKTMPLVATTSLVRDESGEISDVILVFDDQSQIKSLELESNRTQQLALIGILAASLTHEMKNPLVSLRVFAELLPDRYSDPEFRDEFSKIAIAEIDRISDLLLQFRRLGDPVSPRLGAVDPVLVLEGALSVLVGRLTKQQVEIVRDYMPALPCVEADAIQLKQVFLNLLLNSLEAMDKGGIIKLSTCVDRDSPDTMPRGAATVSVRISDTGRGIAEEDRMKIFEPFFTTKDEGSGLGLPICARIIESFQGKIVVESDENDVGAAVTVGLPEHLEEN